MRLTSVPARLVPIVLCCLIVGSCGPQGPTLDTPDGTILYIAQSLNDSRPQALWEALPPSYQADISEIVHELASRIDPQVYDKVFTLLQQAVRVLQSKKDLFLQGETFAKSNADPEEVGELWDTIVPLLDTFLNSDIGHLQAMQTIDLGSYLATTGHDLMTQAAALSRETKNDVYNTEFTARLTNLKVEVISSDQDQATVRISAPDEMPEEVQLVRVEGRWIPQQLASQWEQSMTTARKWLAEHDKEKLAESKMQIMIVLAMAEGVLTQLEQAQTSAELDQALRGIFSTMIGGMVKG